MKTGCAIKPTLRSVDARPQSNRLDGERRDGVFHTPYKNSAFPVTATNASGFYVGELNEAASNTTIRQQFQTFPKHSGGQVVLETETISDISSKALAGSRCFYKNVFVQEANL
ncbi:uncharacterized protein LOC141863554 isoform X1 [Acropora palmata]|uniref:uncharacterized protein LOC141863554 isoform X1 n=1 Tax=Acropora palmata TaxID=6131 RepID=UPI003DA017D2